MIFFDGVKNFIPKVIESDNTVTLKAGFKEIEITQEQFKSIISSPYAAPQQKFYDCMVNFQRIKYVQL